MSEKWSIAHADSARLRLVLGLDVHLKIIALCRGIVIPDHPGVQYTADRRGISVSFPASSTCFPSKLQREWSMFSASIKLRELFRCYSSTRYTSTLFWEFEAYEISAICFVDPSQNIHLSRMIFLIVPDVSCLQHSASRQNLPCFLFLFPAPFKYSAFFWLCVLKKWTIVVL